MAAPEYSTDLEIINLAEDSGTWSELTDWGGGGTIYTDETDFYIQGSYCTSQICTKTGAQAETSLIVDYGSDLSGSFTAGETCVFVWQVFLPANALDTFANGGLRLVVAADVNSFDGWKIGGKDFGRNPYGGWQNVVVDPSFPPDYQDDGATGNGGVYRWFGSGLYLLAAISKGAPHGVDAIRYGRGQIAAIYGDAGNGYATFVGMAAKNDLQANRWGLFQEQAGGYLWKGLMSIGDGTAEVDFRDSNRNIIVDDTPRTYSSFNRIEINHPDSRVDWTGINITALNADGLSIGEFEVMDDAEINFDTCVFTDMGQFIFHSVSTSANIDNCTWRRCDQVTQGLATFDGCVFEGSDSTAIDHVALLASDLDEILNCDFISAGTGHGIELDSNHAGNTYGISNCTFTGYATSDGNTGNEMIYNNSGGAVTINVTGGTFPSIRNGAGASTTVVQSLDWYFEIQDQAGSVVTTAEFRIFATGTETQLYGVETSDGTEKYSFDGSLSGTDADIVVHDLGKIHLRQTLTHPTVSNSAAAPVVLTLVTDRVYENP